jgi:tRNA pseudouridine-54 N-methylase
LADFLLLIEKIIEYKKIDIDKGDTPFEIYRICNCIRETFCLSYAIRKDNNLYLLFLKDLVILWFKGQKLKYLGSDERSQALLLLKALQKTKSIPILDKWIESTPGIYIRKLSNYNIFVELLNQISPIDIIYVSKLESKTVDTSNIDGLSTIINLRDKLYIIPMENIFLKDLEETLFFSILKNLRFTLLPNIKNTQDKILFINFLIDKQNKEPLREP